MTTLRQLLGQLIKSEYVGSTPQIYWDDERRELQGFLPQVKVYTLNSPAQMKGLGYTQRKVMHRLSVDIKGRSQDTVETAKEEILDVLGKNAISPFPTYDVVEYDDGTQHAAYSGFYWWTIEVTVWQIRKDINR